MNHPAQARLVGAFERDAGARASQSPRSFRSPAWLHSFVGRVHPAQRATPAPVRPAVTVRDATANDFTALERLAALESRPVPPPPLLVAEVDGEVQATLSVSTGEAIADPFAPTLELVRLLEVRAEQLEGDGSSRRRLKARLSPA